MDMTQKSLLSNRKLSPMQKAAKLIELEKQQKEIKAQIDEYRADLLNTTRALDVYSLKTGTYTISRVVKKLPRVRDFEALKKALDDAGIPYGTKEVFDDYMSAVFKQAIDEGRELDGLEALESEFIMVRLAKKDDK